MARRVKDEATAAELAVRAAAVRNIPPHVPSATCARDAYPLELICEVHVLDELPWRSLMKACKSAKALEALRASTAPPPPPAYVLSKLPQLAEPGEAVEREALAKALAYLAVLLQLSAAPAVLDDEKVEALGVAPAVASHLLRRFTESEEAGAGRHARYKRTQALCDLLKAHILVIALIVDGFSLQYEPLAKELRVEGVKLVNAFALLGCKINRSGGLPPRAELLINAPAGATLASVLPDTRTRAKAKAKR